MRDREAYRLTQEQVGSIIDRVVPIIAAPEDVSFFRGLLFCVAAECDRKSAPFTRFIAKLLKTAGYS